MRCWEARHQIETAEKVRQALPLFQTQHVRICLESQNLQGWQGFSLHLQAKRRPLVCLPLQFLPWNQKSSPVQRLGNEVMVTPWSLQWGPKIASKEIVAFGEVPLKLDFQWSLIGLPMCPSTGATSAKQVSINYLELPKKTASVIVCNVAQDGSNISRPPKFNSWELFI